MLNKIIKFSLENRLIIVLLVSISIGLGVRAIWQTPVDAFPDSTPIQVQINTTASALSPEEIEQQITLPIELTISGLPGLQNVRSISKFGLSQVVATFDDDTHIYDARQLILERLGSVNLPIGIDSPELGPISTGLGEVFHYTIRSTDPDRTLDELRSLHDWVIKPELRKIAGVAEVNSWGGFEKQYQVVVDPNNLIRFNLTLDDVFRALEQNNKNIGGGQIVSSGQSFLVHGIGRVSTIKQIENIVIKAIEGTPILIGNIADVIVGHEIRRGAVSASGEGEVVLGLGFMLMGQNSNEVTRNLKIQLQSVQKSLPDDIIVEIVYDRTELVKEVIGTVERNLLAGALLVILVLFLLLGNFRAGLIVAFAIPLALIYAFLGMEQLAIAASLLSLGAMDFGIIVDGSVVMTENNLRRLAEKRNALGRKLNNSERLNTILESSQEVVRPIVFGIGIILIVFFPILTLEGIEGKMFKPMAWTFIFAMLGALFIAITLTPIMSYYFLPKNRIKEKNAIDKFLRKYYTLSINKVIQYKLLFLTSVIILLAVTGIIGSRLGGVFIPRLSEGAIVINTIRLAGVSIEESIDYNTKIEKLLLTQFPNEINKIWSRIGTAEVATDPMGLELTDIFISLKPRNQWIRAKTQSELVERFEETVDDLPGLNMIFTQPIEMRINEMASGIRSDVGIKIIGDDFETLTKLSDDVQNILLRIDGASDIAGEQISGQPTIQIHVNQDQISRYGIPAEDVLDIIEVVGNRQVGDIIEGQRRYPLVVRLPDSHRQNVEVLANTLIPTKSGSLLPLHSLVDINETEGPSTINREWGRRLIKVQCNVRNRDIASFVNEAQSRIENELQLPSGYVIEWGGQYENLERSKIRFMIVVPITLILIFLLLYFSLKSVKDVLIIYTGIPLAAVGGIFALWIRGMPFSVSAAVGFIALSGIAVLNGQVLVSTIKRMTGTGQSFKEIVISSAKQRLRPVLATAITDAVGFIPMAVSTGIGAEVQRPLATVIVGGVMTSTLLTLFVLPILYVTINEWKNVKMRGSFKRIRNTLNYQVKKLS
ncbi:MAG: efflux RND transporter permease subunit [Candidatus Marinimicrobia bacterium]|jgi:cobalt-zinc-cadmium resistance protein CzcA|nr:efflux RND transporter permease subunit [Candidatus Neomarinimicrobiota bacterium]MBT3683925.1 efflux RND transporter permease subunit [Candidatus Neomarinimicrobiota bacterium]MBT3760849.1 efflux RND transporter permease subunit [Candidatus Neomarinimicrobiota bacterium]MBT3896771.1 efflux RND transporter permease subunit [Candidatus Neomarinimicrobiota bacterium]MBT4173935.1 efflux RND transporter permease subunit [Candidatus Neomarinimicrobiota bacterium]